MKESYATETLSLDVLSGIKFEDVLYGERSQAGAMGNAGGIILYVLQGEELYKYETNAFKDPKTAEEALRQITLHEDMFTLYYGGMGNGVFINKKVSRAIDTENECFWFVDCNQRHRVDSSVKGVFLRVSDVMTGKRSADPDPLQQSWEQHMRSIYNKKP